MLAVRVFSWFRCDHVVELVADSGGVSPARTAYPAGDPHHGLNQFRSVVCSCPGGSLAVGEVEVGCPR
jgi:hypothetical protein